MKKFRLTISPAVIMQMLNEGRYLFEIRKGLDPKKKKKIQLVSVDTRNGNFIICFEQQELIDLPEHDRIINELNPQINITGVPDDLNKLTQKLQAISDICGEKLGAPEGRPYDIIEFLKNDLVPRHEAAERPSEQGARLH